jgi:hypothetical protein
MRPRASLLAAVVLSSLLFGCGSGREDSATDAERLDPDNCPASTVRMVSKMQHYDPFCGQPCTSTSDCPSGMACVVDIYGIPDPAIPVCVSDCFPPPLGGSCGGLHDGGLFHLDGAESTCVDSMTLGKRYANEKTSVAGYEHIACPQGCEATGVGWQATARCL